MSVEFDGNGEPLCGICGYAAFATKGKDATGRFLKTRDYTTGPLIFICVLCRELVERCTCLERQPWLTQPQSAGRT